MLKQLLEGKDVRNTMLSEIKSLSLGIKALLDDFKKRLKDLNKLTTGFTQDEAAYHAGQVNTFEEIIDDLEEVLKKYK